MRSPRLHAMPWADYRADRRRTGAGRGVRCRERLLLLHAPVRRALSRRGPAPSATGSWPAGTPSTARAPAAARDLIARPVGRPGAAPRGARPAARRRASTATSSSPTSRSLDDGRVALIDWQMMTLAPVAVELGWLLVSNSASLPIEPEEVLTATATPPAVPLPRRSLRLGLGGPTVARPGATRIDPAAARPRADDRRLGRAAGPDLDRRPAAARLAQGPRCRGGRRPRLGRPARRTTSPGGRRGRSRPPAGGSDRYARSTDEQRSRRAQDRPEPARPRAGQLSFSQGRRGERLRLRRRPGR